MTMTVAKMVFGCRSQRSGFPSRKQLGVWRWSY